jgi:hypothetical protein
MKKESTRSAKGKPVNGLSGINYANTVSLLNAASSTKGRPLHLTLTVRLYPSPSKLSTWSGWISTQQLERLNMMLETLLQLLPIDEIDRSGTSH